MYLFTDKHMKKIAVITAGGAGSRMGTVLPKQFLLLNERPILWHTIQAFVSAFTDIQLILVLPADYMTAGIELITEMGLNSQTILVQGGATRFDSVKNGLAKITEPAIIFVHDGVRCLITTTLIKQCYNQAIEIGTAIPAVAATDSIRMESNGINQSIDRNKIRIIQTPQTFNSNILLPAFQQPYQETFTDEASVVEANGSKVHLIEGDNQNLKITRPIDLIIAAQILADRKV
jgi:2-C-methyl-D-erythritol 4-phosphate cytidylyltransferase